jgi:nicotinate phosphoribosyltransferase
VARTLSLPGPVVIRLDSGDLGALAVTARRLLDEAGLPARGSFASGGLDEYAIAGPVARGAPIDAFGVGTKMGTSADGPYLDSAYKLTEFGGRPVMKLSEGKATLPGAKQVLRGPGGGLLALRGEPAPPGYRQLLAPVMRHGIRLHPPKQLAAARQRCARALAWLPHPARQLRSPAPVPVAISPASSALRHHLASQLRPPCATPAAPP